MPAAIPILGSVAGAVASSALSSSSPSGSTTQTSQQTIDPRIAAILFGSGKTLKQGVTPTYAPGTEASKTWVPDSYNREGDLVPGHYNGITQTGVQNNPESDYNNDTGILGKILSQLNTSQNPDLTKLGTEINGALGASGLSTLGDTMTAARGLQGSNLTAPSMTGAQIGQTQVAAPGQNNLDLTSAYNKMINGNPAENPYLTGAIQKGLNQSQNTFNTLQGNATDNLLRNVLPAINSGSRINGVLGGSRQGIAQGVAIGDYQKALQQTLSQVGQNNTDAAVSAQAGAFDSGQNRAAGALSGLSGQQYGVASQNAQLGQAGNMFNATSANSAAQNNGNWLQSILGLNSSNKLAGINASNQTLGNMYNYGTAQDQYGTNQLGKVSGLLGQFLGAGSGQTQTSPYYTNPVGNATGGGLLGYTLSKGFGSQSQPTSSAGWNGQGINPYDYANNYG